MCDLNAVQTNVHHSLIWEFILYKFELDHNASKTTKNIWAKDEDTFNHYTVTRGFMKFHLCCKKLDNQTRADRPKTVDSKSVFQAVEENQMSCTQRVSGELSISMFCVIHHLHNFTTTSAAELCFMLLKYCKTFD